MASKNLEKIDLKYTYNWKQMSNISNLRQRYLREMTLDRKDGYEVLFFINIYIKYKNYDKISGGLKAERIIKEYLPNDINRYDNIKLWLDQNWDKFI